jgi:hypothetical protein
MTTVLPPATPVVIVVWACAAIGAAIAPAIAAMANSLFRMVNSFARRGAGFSPAHTMRGQFIACGIVPVKPRPYTRHFWGIVAEAGTR